MNLLPNMRLLGISSENEGMDWFEKQQLIDQKIEASDWELTEEVSYLFFSHTPQDILEGRGECFVARPVTGPKREVAAPWILKDWTAAPVWQHEIQGQTLLEMLNAAQKARTLAQKELKKMQEPFILCVRRKLIPELVIETLVLFNE